MASPPPFVFPSSLHDLEEEPDGGERRLCVATWTDVSSLRAADLEEFVKGAAPHGEAILFLPLVLCVCVCD